MKHRYGWRPQLPDKRDRALLLPAVALPPSVDLRNPAMPPVWDQGSLGSCTAHAIAAAYEYARQTEGLQPIMPSRLFIYYNERKMEGTIGQDAGACIRDGIKSLTVQGVCDESLWPYDINSFIVTPPDAAYNAAVADLLVQYQSPNQDLASLKGALAAGLPFVVGISVYDSFESPAVEVSGDVPMPGPDESLLGGHAIAIVGYDDSIQQFIFRNSWGAGWGRGGCGALPYAYLTDLNLASDFWVIQRVT